MLRIKRSIPLRENMRYNVIYSLIKLNIRNGKSIDLKIQKDVDKMSIKNIKRNIIIILALVLLFNISVYADSTDVVTLGKDLDTEQRDQMLEIFNVKKEDVVIIEVNNDEEREYLEGIASDAQLGTRTISSAYVEVLKKDSGIFVETYNISWVTKEMFQSALVTAGVKDAKIIAAAPFPVSGTGALTGILKAFEEATGEKISEEQKEVAIQEVYWTGELGEDIGQDKASDLIRIVKEEIISKDIKNIEDIKNVIINIAGDLNINLSQDQINSISGLMDKINDLDLNTEEVKNQLKNIGKKLEDVVKNNEEVRTLLQRILDAIKEFFNSVFNR